MKTKDGKLLRCQFDENLKNWRGNHAGKELAESAGGELRGSNWVYAVVPLRQLKDLEPSAHKIRVEF